MSFRLAGYANAATGGTAVQSPARTATAWQIRSTAYGYPVVVRSWVCVWCGCRYRGEKFCRTCGTGIYSTELANWQASGN
ncbi:hypothetical protein FPC62_26185 [Salmonella enterica]|nr:hypothetical protein [Salmonella enterica subsp. enterica serovar Pensacola]ECH3817473.1 hypothetical protein [Salmonella enterica]EDR4319641.1 hypothetical protein [Salmonella enterica subsp. enterica serovar Berta]EDR6294187.1 hypothetical protein [Salmonella enterica subsp. enterica serovar Pensacola]EEB7430824.1 hypothetical protein [Salmonella enterica]